MTPARSPLDVLASLVRKLPQGWALGARGGVLDVLLEAAGVAIAAAERGATDMMVETDPRAAVRLLADFERVLGPSCGRDPATMTLTERQLSAHQRWTARGGASIPYLTGMAANLGVVIAINEFWPTRANAAWAGMPLRPEGCQFVWQVIVPRSTPQARLDTVRCEMRRITPAHTKLVIHREGDI